MRVVGQLLAAVQGIDDPRKLRIERRSLYEDECTRDMARSAGLTCWTTEAKVREKPPPPSPPWMRAIAFVVGLAIIAVGVVVACYTGDVVTAISLISVGVNWIIWALEDDAAPAQSEQQSELTHHNDGPPVDQQAPNRAPEQQPEAPQEAAPRAPERPEAPPDLRVDPSVPATAPALEEAVGAAERVIPIQVMNTYATAVPPDFRELQRSRFQASADPEAQQRRLALVGRQVDEAAPGITAARASARSAEAALAAARERHGAAVAALMDETAVTVTVRLGLVLQHAGTGAGSAAEPVQDAFEDTARRLFRPRDCMGLNGRGLLESMGPRIAALRAALLAEDGGLLRNSNAATAAIIGLVNGGHTTANQAGLVNLLNALRALLDSGAVGPSGLPTAAELAAAGDSEHAGQLREHAAAFDGMRTACAERGREAMTLQLLVAAASADMDAD